MTRQTVKMQLRYSFYANKMQSKPDEVAVIEVQRNEGFGWVDFGPYRGKPFTVEKVNDDGTVKVKFDRGLVCRPDDPRDTGNTETIGPDETCFRTPTTDSGMAVCLKVIHPGSNKK